LSFAIGTFRNEIGKKSQCDGRLTWYCAFILCRLLPAVSPTNTVAQQLAGTSAITTPLARNNHTGLKSNMIAAAKILEQRTHLVPGSIMTRSKPFTSIIIICL
jgi:hypothetical protein